MPRLIAIALLALNLVLFGFHLTRAAPPPEPPPPRLMPEEASRIVLLEELRAEKPVSAAAMEARCYSAGPFETPRSRAQARERLEPVSLSLFERESETLIELGYWVALPPSDSFDEAGGTVRALREAGFEDVAMVTDAAGEIRVSLGYFLAEVNARSHRDRLREKGFAAETRLRREPQRRFWLDYRLRANAKNPSVASGATLVDEFTREIPCDERLLAAAEG